MDEDNFYTELYNTLDNNGIGYSDNRNNRDTAIKIILELKRRKAGIIVMDEHIIEEYMINGINGIKKMFNKNDCYLYETDFVFNILFYHYKNEWTKIETLIKDRL